MFGKHSCGVSDSDYLYGLSSTFLSDFLHGLKDILVDEEDWHTLNDDIWVGLV